MRNRPALPPIVARPARMYASRAISRVPRYPTARHPLPAPKFARSGTNPSLAPSTAQR